MKSKLYPVITEDKQKLYEKLFLEHSDLTDNIPVICGYYGRACRKMNKEANSMLCNGSKCSLSIFISTTEAISEYCKEKNKNNIKDISELDICNIMEELQRKKLIKVEFFYIETILIYLSECELN